MPMRPSKRLLSIDLEMNQDSGKIIQIGAVVGDIRTGEILEELSLFVNPHEQLSEYIINLTGIKQYEVDEGVELENAYKVLVDFKRRNNCFHCPITWGGEDMKCLKEQCKIEPKDWEFGRNHFDAKKLFQSYCLANDLNLQSGLGKSLVRMKLNFEGKAHNAIDDARNTFKIYKHLLQYFKEGPNGSN